MDQLIAEINRQIEVECNKKIEQINTPLKLAEYCTNHQTKYKNPGKSLAKAWRRSADKCKAEAHKKITDAENAHDFIGEFIITVEWKKSRMWGRNPKAFTNHGFESNSIGGCGYDKLSTATAQALNSNLSILKLMYEKKNENINISNHELLGYGSGYDFLPYFEGGVGDSNHIKICENIGLKMQKISSTESTDVYLLTNKE